MSEQTISRESRFIALVESTLFTSNGQCHLSENEQLLICVMAGLHRKDSLGYFLPRQILQAIPDRFYYEQPWADDDIHFLMDSIRSSQGGSGLISTKDTEFGRGYRLDLPSGHILILRNRFASAEGGAVPARDD